MTGSGTTEPAAPLAGPPDPSQAEDATRLQPAYLPLLRDAGVVLAWFVVAGAVAALVWWQVTPLAEYTRTATAGQLSEEQLGREVAADGWYVVIAAVGGLLSGVALAGLRRRDPLATVLLVAVGAFLASWVMIQVGLWVGPPDPGKALAHAATGAKVPMQLKTQATGAFLVWPITALLGAVGVLWGIDEHRRRRPRDG
ncbi:MAG TPA: hypothetical protein VF416_02735 [Marmoricola sp.]